MRRAVAALALLVAATALGAPYAGRPLIDALRDLERRGLHLIYSSETIQPELTVREEPRATDPRAVLDELLRPHHLHAVPGPKGTLVIVRDPAPAPSRAATPPAAAPMPVAVDQIVVTPSHFGILGSQPEQRQFLSRDDVRALPHFSDDIYRAINRIPGSAASDVSASFNIRGGAQDEVEVLLDGVEIYEPFHVKDLFNAFSTLDAEAMGSVDVLTGGFPAEYGGRLSGVIDIASLTPSERRTEVGISLLNSRALSAGAFGEGRGQWLFSFRPGYLHALLQMVNKKTGLDPSYYDLFGKAQWQFSDRTIVSANVLASHDRLRLNDNDIQARSRSSNDTVWLNARSALTPRLFSRNVLSAGRVGERRDGVFVEQDEQGSLAERRFFHFVTLRNDTSWDWTARHEVKAGFTAERVRAGFNFVGDASESFNIFHSTPNAIHHDANLHPGGTSVAAYAADRIALRPNLVVEAGVRADRQSYTPDGAHVTPRLNLGWALTPSTSIRAGWGRFAQPQRVEELQVEDGVTSYFPAQMATHAVLGVDHRFEGGWSVRVETYAKHLTHVRPRFENAFDSVTIFPEIRGDRIEIAPSRGLARGTELLVRHDGDGPWSGWVSYVRSFVRDEVDGRLVPRSWDQRDAIGFSVNYGFPDRWNVNVAGTIHSGWPTTSLSAFTTPVPPSSFMVHVVPGPFNDDRLPAYSRVDLRASRSVPIASGHLNFFVEVMNLFNEANASRVNFDINVDRSGRATTVRHTPSIVPLLPSFGVAWQF